MTQYPGVVKKANVPGRCREHYLEGSEPSFPPALLREPPLQLLGVLERYEVIEKCWGDHRHVW